MKIVVVTQIDADPESNPFASGAGYRGKYFGFMPLDPADPRSVDDDEVDVFKVRGGFRVGTPLFNYPISMTF